MTTLKLARKAPERRASARTPRTLHVVAGRVCNAAETTVSVPPPRPYITPEPRPRKVPTLPGWWQSVTRAQKAAAPLSLLGLPASPTDPARPLAAVQTGLLLPTLVAAGLPEAKARIVLKQLRLFRLSQRYTRACIGQDVAVDLLTGEPAGAVTEQQKADAAKRMEEFK